MKLERDLMKQIDRKLSSYEFSGEVLWWLRINAGRVKTCYGSYLRLAKKGTPDYIMLVRGKQEELLAVFIEAKSDTGKTRKEQDEFFDKYRLIKDIHVITINDVRYIDEFMKFYAIDTTKEMQSWNPTD